MRNHSSYECENGSVREEQDWRVSEFTTIRHNIWIYIYIYSKVPSRWINIKIQYKTGNKSVYSKIHFYIVRILLLLAANSFFYEITKITKKEVQPIYKIIYMSVRQLIINLKSSSLYISYLR